MDYIYHILIIILIYVMLSQSLSLTAGYTGLISLAHAGFYGIGAYTSAILSVNFGLSFPITLSIAMFINGLMAMAISIVALRTVEDYYIIITLGIQVIAFSVMNNWMSMTNGPMGISDIPQISILGFPFESKISFCLLTLFFALTIFALIRNVARSPFGRVLIAISEDEVFTKSLGKNIYVYKLTSFTLGGIFASIPGALYAHYISYIDPTSFNLNESIFILSIVIIGGMRNLFGIALAAAILVLIPEVLRFIGMPNDIAANVRQIIYGIALVVMIFKYSNGFISKKYIGPENF